jgi:uncharacterized protein (TIGR02266 family)
MMTSPSAEKRGSHRLPVQLTAHCQLGTRFIRDPIADLSESGLYLKTREPTREGAPVRVALALPYTDGPRFCTLVGRIARVDRDGRGTMMGVGVRFSAEEIAAVDRATLNTFLSLRRPAA